MKVHETHPLAGKWKRLTGTSLRQFIDIMPWNGTVLPNTDALDEWLNPAEGESIRDALERQYGPEALEIMNKLFK